MTMISMYRISLLVVIAGVLETDAKEVGEMTAESVDKERVGEEFGHAGRGKIQCTRVAAEPNTGRELRTKLDITGAC